MTFAAARRSGRFLLLFFLPRSTAFRLHSSATLAIVSLLRRSLLAGSRPPPVDLALLGTDDECPPRWLLSATVGSFDSMVPWRFPVFVGLPLAASLLPLSCCHLHPFPLRCGRCTNSRGRERGNVDVGWRLGFLLCRHYLPQLAEYR